MEKGLVASAKPSVHRVVVVVYCITFHFHFIVHSYRTYKLVRPGIAGKSVSFCELLWHTNLYCAYHPVEDHESCRLLLINKSRLKYREIVTDDSVESSTAALSL